MDISKEHVFLTSTQDINEICAPLKNHLDIPTFAYLKLFNDGSAINLHSNREIIQNYYDKKLYQYSTFFNSIENYQSGFVLWSLLDTHPIILKTRERFQVGHGITFINKIENAVEFFHFAGALTHQKIQHIYINNLDLLERFSQHFRQKAVSFIKRAEQSKIYLSTLERPNNFANQTPLYLKNEKTRQQFLNECEINLNQQLLSKRETECLHYLMQGKSTKEIAKNLNLSPRTTEHYLDNVKTKLNVTSKYELIMKMKSEQQWEND